jgi:hypothetical protein
MHDKCAPTALSSDKVLSLTLGVARPDSVASPTPILLANERPMKFESSDFSGDENTGSLVGRRWPIYGSTAGWRSVFGPWSSRSDTHRRVSQRSRRVWRPVPRSALARQARRRQFGGACRSWDTCSSTVRSVGRAPLGIDCEFSALEAAVAARSCVTSARNAPPAGTLDAVCVSRRSTQAAPLSTACLDTDSRRSRWVDTYRHKEASTLAGGIAAVEEACHDPTPRPR